jgi:hypothetical protein
MGSLTQALLSISMSVCWRHISINTEVLILTQLHWLLHQTDLMVVLPWVRQSCIADVTDTVPKIQTFPAFHERSGMNVWGTVSSNWATGGITLRHATLADSEHPEVHTVACNIRDTEWLVCNAPQDHTARPTLTRTRWRMPHRAGALPSAAPAASAVGLGPCSPVCRIQH